ncbi:pro-corazonin-like [Teleopsis dalmanni]|uniref:pro-corazonin-like n=1 Tax=Teleopsis dalmanni TaxID=139649 RepID=UPI0018CFB83C|nr:pro-corazonin-like [Teleopsis dalmanni]
MLSLCKMLMLPLLLFTFFSMACMGQTFQYSRGWTNGKRANLGTGAARYRDESNIPELMELQGGERKLEKCLIQLQHFMHNPLLRAVPYAGTLNLASTSNANPNSNSNNNNNNNLFSNRHQSNEIFEDLNGAEVTDYGKH